MSSLSTAFFQRDVLEVARDLIGVELVWHGCSGVIVETEAYAAEGDEACHTATRPSAREFMRLHAPGAAYVYFNYGVHWMFNLLVKGGARDGLILVRALEPRSGLEQMRERRGRERLRDLCSGPGKLAAALAIHGEHHGTAMTGRARPGGVGLRPASDGLAVVADVRVGISRAADFPWRFLAAGSQHVSVPAGKVKPHVPAARGARSPRQK